MVYAYGVCMAYVWYVSSVYGTCSVSSVHGMCTVCVWPMYGMCLVSSVPSERGQGAGAGPGVLSQGEVGEGAELQALGQGPQLVSLKVQRLDRRHAGERTV